METGAASNVFVVGDYVVAYGAGPEGYAYNGQIAKIVEIREDRKFSGQFLMQGQEGTASSTLIAMDFDHAEGIIYREHVEKLADYLKTVLSITTLEKEMVAGQLSTCRETLSRVKSSFSTSVQIISDCIWEESDKRGWCDEVKEFIVRVNELLPSDYELDLRKQEYDVEVVVTGTASTTHSLAVMASSQEEADEMVKDSPDDYFDPEEVLNDAYRLDWDSVEVDVQ